LSQPRPADYALLGLLGCLWGTSFLFTDVAVREIPPAALTVFRTALASAVLLALCAAMGLMRRLRPGQLALLAVVGFTGNGIPFTLIGWGQERIASGLAAILLSAVPVFALLLSAAVSHDDRLSPGKLAGVGLGLAGVVLLVGVEVLGGLGRTVWGQLAIVGAALAFAVNTVLAKRVTGLPLPFLSGVALGFGALSALPVALTVEQPFAALPGSTALAAAAALGLVSTATGSLIFFRLLSTSQPSFVSLVNYIIPLVGVFWGTVLLDETFGWRAVAALALILGGVALVGRSRPRAPRG